MRAVSSTRRTEFLEHELRAQTSLAVSRFGKRFDVVAATPPPRDVAEIKAVMDSVVGERDRRCWSMASQSRSSAAMRSSNQSRMRQAVAALRRGRQAEQLHGSDVIQDGSV